MLTDIISSTGAPDKELARGLTPAEPADDTTSSPKTETPLTAINDDDLSPYALLMDIPPHVGRGG